MTKRKPPAPPRLGRRGSLRQPKLELLIFCEGGNTEPHYIRNFAREHANNLVKIEIIAPAGVPTTLVAKAIEAYNQIGLSKNSFEQHDQVWVVFDRDDHLHVDQAIAHAEAVGVHVAFSNPCFEIWLLLHYTEFDAPDNRHEVQQKLTKHDRNYDPDGRKEASYLSLSLNYALARVRAVRMRARRRDEGKARSEPYTNVDLLTELIVENGRS